MILLFTVAVLMVQPGIAGIAVGETSATAGWWLLVVGGALLLAVIVLRGRRAA